MSFILFSRLVPLPSLLDNGISSKVLIVFFVGYPAMYTYKAYFYLLF